jgi:hypothetical protein
MRTKGDWVSIQFLYVQWLEGHDELCSRDWEIKEPYSIWRPYRWREDRRSYEKKETIVPVHENNEILLDWASMCHDHWILLRLEESGSLSSSQLIDLSLNSEDHREGHMSETSVGRWLYSDEYKRKVMAIYEDP